MHYTYSGEADITGEIPHTTYHLSVQVRVCLSTVAKIKQDEGKHKFHHTAVLSVFRFLNSFFSKCCVNGVITVCPFFLYRSQQGKGS